MARRIWFLNWECGILASEPPGKSLILTLKGEIAVVEIQLHIIHTHTHTHTSHTFVRTIIHISSASQLGIVLFPTAFLYSRTFGNMWGQLFGYCSDWGCDSGI